MNIKSVITGVVLTAAIAFSAPAFASTSINGTALSGSDASSVQSRCNQLQTSAASPVSLADMNAHTYSDTDQRSYSNGKVDPLAQATTRINLYSISLKDCVQAGFVASE